MQAALLRPTRKALCNCDEHEEAAKAWRERSELLEEQCRRYATLLAGAQRDMEMLKGENEQLRMSLGMSEKNRMAAIGTANDYMARQQSQQQSYIAAAAVIAAADGDDDERDVVWVQRAASAELAIQRPPTRRETRGRSTRARPTLKASGRSRAASRTRG